MYIRDFGIFNEQPAEELTVSQRKELALNK